MTLDMIIMCFYNIKYFILEVVFFFFLIVWGNFLFMLYFKEDEVVYDILDRIKIEIIYFRKFYDF